MAQLTRFETRGLNAADRLVGWASFISSTPGRLLTAPCGDVPFSGSMAIAQFGPLRIVQLKATPHRLEKPAGEPGLLEMVRIVIQVRGRAMLSQEGQDIILEPGCWAAWSTDRAHVITNLTDVEQYALLIPMANVGMKLADILRQAGNRLGDRPGVGRLLPDYVARLFEQAEAIGPSLHAEVADIVVHLVILLRFGGHAGLAGHSLLGLLGG